MANSNVDIANKIFTYVKHGCDINKDIKTIYYNSLIFIGDEQQIYVPVMDTYVGIKKSQFDELSNNLLWIPSIGTYSITTKEGNNLSSGNYAISTGINTIASGLASFTQGENTIASGQDAHAEGYFTSALGNQTHAEGWGTTTYGAYAHAEGWNTKANTNGHAEGADTYAYGNISHAEGWNTISKGLYSHTEGQSTITYAESAHAEGNNTEVDINAKHGHAEGSFTKVISYAAHAEGWLTYANGESSHAEGKSTIAYGKNSHVEGELSYTYGETSHSEGKLTYAYGNYSHSEGNNTYAYGETSHSEGNNNTSYGNYSHVEGDNNIAYGISSHAEGNNTYTHGNYSHTEGQSTITYGESSHAEGAYSKANKYAHAEGKSTYAYGESSHSEGNNTIAHGNSSHTEGNYTYANGKFSHAEGAYTYTYNLSEHANGSYNFAHKASDTFGDDGNTQFTIGIGTSNNDRKNAFEISQSGYIYTYNIGNYNIDYNNKHYNGTNPLPGENDLKTILDNKKDIILLEKTFDPYIIQAQNSSKGYIYFLNVVPKSDNYFEPWFIHYRLFITTNQNGIQGEYDCIIGTAGTSLNYHVFNRFYSGYYPSYYHLIAWHNSASKYANRETNPIKLGERIYSASYDNTLARIYKIQILELYNCTASFPDNIETYDSFYTDANYGYNTSINATSIGLQETGDINYPNYYNYYYYNSYRIHGTDTPLYRYKFVGFDKNMKIIPFDITNQTNGTIIQKTPCTVPMTVSNGIALYYNTTAITSPTQNIGTGVLFFSRSDTGGQLLYNFNTSIYNTHSNIYYVGNYNEETDEFVLDNSSVNSWYLLADNNLTADNYNALFSAGKYYWFLGQTTNDSSAFNFTPDHPLYYFNGICLIPINAKKNHDSPWIKSIGETNSAILKNSTSIASGDFSVAEGNASFANGENSHAEGSGTIAEGDYSHAEIGSWVSELKVTGNTNATQYTGIIDSSEINIFYKYGFISLSTIKTIYESSFIDPLNTTYTDNNIPTKITTIDFADPGDGTITFTLTTQKTLSEKQALNNTSIYIYMSIAYGDYSHMESGSIAFGERTHSEGKDTIAIGNASHSEGYQVISIGDSSHAEGFMTATYGSASHAEGLISYSLGLGSHSEGSYTYAVGAYSHAEGRGILYHNTFTIIPLSSNEKTRIQNYYHTTYLYYTDNIYLGENTILYNDSYYLKYITSVTNAVRSQNVITLDDNTNLNGVLFNVSPGVLEEDKIYYFYNGNKNTALGEGSHSEGISTYAGADGAHAEGYGSYAMALEAHAEGSRTQALGTFSHAEGNSTIAEGTSGHAEGYGTSAIGKNSHAEGSKTVANKDQSHAEGNETQAIGNQSHAEGDKTTVTDAAKAGHAEGSNTTVSSLYGHAEGTHTTVSNTGGHAEGYYSKSSGAYAHAEGYSSATGAYAHSEGRNTSASTYSHAEGYLSAASGQGAHAEGHNTKATAKYSHSEGEDTEAISAYAHAEGNETHAIGENSHAEGYKTYGKGKYSHTEGRNTLAYGQSSHTEGAFTYAYDGADYAHAEGFASYALGSNAHAENYKTVASGDGAHSEGGFTYALGKNSHTEGDHTYTYNTYEHAQGRYNISHQNSDTWGDSLNSLHTIGIGTNWNSRRNAIVVMQNGDIYTYNIGNYDGRNPESAETLQETTYRLSVWEKSTGNNSGRLINGNGLAQGELSVVSGVYTVAYNQGEFGVGSYNVSRSNNTQFTVGIGNSESNRKNAFEIANNGNAYFINIDNFNGNSNINSSRPLQTMIYSHELAITQSTLQDNSTYFGYALIGISTNNSGKNLSHTISYQIKAFTTKEYVDALMKSNDALRYCGTVTPASAPNGIFTLHHKAIDDETFNTHGLGADIDCGAVYKVDSSGYFGTEKVCAGDMVISYSDNITVARAKTSNEGWNVINENLDLRTDPQTEAYNNAANDKVLTNVNLSGDGTLSYTAHSLSILNKTGQYKPTEVQTGTDSSASGPKNLIFNGTTQGYKIITNVSLNQNGLTTELSYSYAYFYANQKHHTQGKTDKGKNHLSLSYTQFITNIALSADGKLSYDYGEFNVEESEHALISTGLDEVVLKSGSDTKGVIVELFADENNENKLTYSYIDLTSTLADGTYDRTISGNDFYISYITELSQDEHGKISYSYSYAHIDYPFIFGTYNNDKANATLKNGHSNSSGAYSVAEGYFTSAQADYAHSEGYNSIANGTGSHVEGGWTRAGTNDSINYGSNLVNESNYVNYSYTHAEGYGSIAKGFASHAEGNMSHSSGHLSHAEGRYTQAVGQASHSEGQKTKANGKNSHAEGLDTLAYAPQSHAEGYNTDAHGESSHAEGSTTIASAQYSHAEGQNTKASGSVSHAEGFLTEASGIHSHAEGSGTKATNKYTHSEGWYSQAIGEISHAEGSYARASSYASHAEGWFTTAKGEGSHAEGKLSYTDASQAHAEGQLSYALGKRSHAEGYNTYACGEATHSEGYGSYIHNNSNYAHAEGLRSYIFNANSSHAEGENTYVLANYAHAEGFNTYSVGEATHTEGHTTYAFGSHSHAEGQYSYSLGSKSHSEGYNSYAIGDYTHAEGYHTYAIKPSSHSEGYHSYVYGEYGHGEGINTTVTGLAGHAEGYYSYAYADKSHAEGEKSYAFGSSSHVEGQYSYTFGTASHAEGFNTYAYEQYSHAEGLKSYAYGEVSHAEGHSYAYGNYSHSENYNTYAYGNYSHAEGINTYTESTATGGHAEGNWTHAKGQYSHAEGSGVTSVGDTSHAEGISTESWGIASHAEGYHAHTGNDVAHAEGNYTHANGKFSHAEGAYTYTYNLSEHATGSYNFAHKVSDDFGNDGNTQFTIGIGTAQNNRKNAFEISQSGYIYTYNIGNYSIDYNNKRYNGTNPLPGENDLKTILNNKKDIVLLEKKFDPYTISASNKNKGYIYFLNVVPKNDNYFEPWFIHYRLIITTNETATQGEYDCIVGTAGTSINYHIFNRFYSTSYYPSYYHLMAWYNSASKYANRETNPIKIGERIQSARQDTALPRIFKIQILELYNCTASFTDNIETYDSFYTDANYGYNSEMNATSVGLQETSDTNTPNYYNYEYYVGYRVHGADTPLYRYKFVGFDERNHIVPITITNQTNATIVQKTPCSVPMIVSRGLALYNTTTEISTTQNNINSSIATGVLYRDSSVLSGILPYNLNTAVTANNDVYLVGNYNPETDEFTLDTSIDDSNKYTKYYNIVPIVTAIEDFKNYFETGKYYWYLGQIPTNASYFNFQQSNHTLFYFDGENLVPVGAKIAYNNPWERGVGENSAQLKNSGSLANGDYSVAEGQSNTSIGASSHSEGQSNTATGIGSHVEGTETQAVGNYSHTEGWKTKTSNDYEHAQGKWNVSTSGKTLHSIGIGTSESNRKNAFEVYNDGTTYIYESTYIGWRVNTTKLNIKSAEVLLQSGTTTNTVINLTSIAGLQFTDTKKLWGTI